MARQTKAMVAERLAELGKQLTEKEIKSMKMEEMQAMVTELEQKNAQTELTEEEVFDAELSDMRRANRMTIESCEEGYVAHFFRTHKHVGDILVKIDEHSNSAREQARAWAIGQCGQYGIYWQPEMQKQAWERKYNTYMTDEQVAEDALTLVHDALHRLADKSRYEMVINGIEVTAVSPKESNLSYVENGRYTKSGAWCVADIELEIDVLVAEHSMRMVYTMEMKSGQICKPKTTIAEWNEIVARELELNGIEVKTA